MSALSLRLHVREEDALLKGAPLARRRSSETQPRALADLVDELRAQAKEAEERPGKERARRGAQPDPLLDADGRSGVEGDGRQAQLL